MNWFNKIQLRSRLTKKLAQANSQNQILILAKQNVDLKTLKRLIDQKSISYQFISISSIEDIEDLLEWDEEKFDHIVLYDVLGTIAYDRWILQIVHRLLKDDGFCIGNIYNKLSVFGFLIGVKKVLKIRSKILLNFYYLPRFFKRVQSIGFYTDTSVWLNNFRSEILFELKKASWIYDGTKVAFPSLEEHKKVLEDTSRPEYSLRERWIKLNTKFSNVKPQAMSLEDYTAKNVLVLAPHPDDEIIGCGGTIMKLIQAGARVSVVHFTDGSSSMGLANYNEQKQKSIRIEHAARVSKQIGFEYSFYLKDSNPTLEPRADLIFSFSQILNEIKPVLIFVPFVADAHKDHVQLNRILATSLREFKDIDGLEIASYEVWSLIPPNFYCVVTELMKKKRELLYNYRTEMRIDDYVKKCVDSHLYHSQKLIKVNAFVEPFIILPAKEYLKDKML